MRLLRSSLRPSQGFGEGLRQSSSQRRVAHNDGILKLIPVRIQFHYFISKRFHAVKIFCFVANNNN